MVKVLHLITELDVGGAEHMLLKLVTASGRGSLRHVVVSMAGEGVLGGRFKELGIPLFALGMRSGRSSIRAFFCLVGLLRRERPDVLQTWLYHADLMGLLAGKLARVPKIVWNVRCTDLDYRDYSFFIALLIYILARFSRWPDAVIVNSETGREQHRKRGYRPKVWRVIPNGFDLEEFHPDPGAGTRLRRNLELTEGSLLIGLVARYNPMKDHAGFLKAAGRIGKTHPEARFVLAGKGVTPDNINLKREIGRQNLENRVYLLGERRDVPAIMAGLDILVSSSAYGEGFPNVIGEAMACGIPCVVTEIGDSARIVGDAGRAVPPNDPAALAAGVCELIALGPEGRARLGMNARKRAGDMFNLPAVAGEYERLYRGFTAASGEAPSP